MMAVRMSNTFVELFANEEICSCAPIQAPLTSATKSLKCIITGGLKKLLPTEDGIREAVKIATKACIAAAYAHWFSSNLLVATATGVTIALFEPAARFLQELLTRVNQRIKQFFTSS